MAQIPRGAHGLGVRSTHRSGGVEAQDSCVTRRTPSRSPGGSAPERADSAALDECEQAMRSLFDSALRDLRHPMRGRRTDRGRARRPPARSCLLRACGPEDPIAIDCIEFGDDLRHLGCSGRDRVLRDGSGLSGIAPIWRIGSFAVTPALSDDFQLYGVIDYYIIHRAVIRAAVAGVAAQEPELGDAGPPRRRG